MNKKLNEILLKKLSDLNDFTSNIPDEQMPDFTQQNASDSGDEEEDWTDDELEYEVTSEQDPELDSKKFYANPYDQNVFERQFIWRKGYAKKRTTIIGYDDQWAYIPCYRCLTKFKVDAMDWNYAGPYMYDLAKYAGFKSLPDCDYTIPQLRLLPRGNIFKKLEEITNSTDVDVEFNNANQALGLNNIKDFIFGTASPSGRPVLLEDKSLNFEQKLEEYLSIMEQACTEIATKAEPRWSSFWVNYPKINSVPYPAIRLHLHAMRNAFNGFKQAQKLALPVATIMGDSNMIEDKNQNIQEDIDQLNEKYSDEELHDLIGKTFNQQKIENIYRRKKYDTPELFAHTKCTECGREKRVMLSNLVKDPTKYGSCVCADSAIDGRVNHATALYNNTKRLRSNTSGYTGVSYVKTYAGQPYDKWRAYIEIDGKRTYLGDFDDKKDAIEARKHAGEKGVKWYRQNRNKLIKNMRMRTRKYGTSKYRDTDIKRPEAHTQHED